MQIGNYLIKKTIAEGSFGRTYLAEHVLLKVPVCIKQESTLKPEYQAWFKQEARLLWDINHTSLPSLKDYIETTDQQLIVMSFIKGKTLDKIVEENGFIDDEHLCWILQRCLDGLSYLHYKGLIHCDLKPQNIILNIEEHNATIIDFGMVVDGPNAITKPKGGTNGYMPPEFLQGKPPIPQSDLFSLGKVMMYLSGGNIVTNQLPESMCKELKYLLLWMTRFDPLARPENTIEINNLISTLRMKIWNRSSTVDMISYRST